ncbi:leucine-rich repeat-containing protein 63-like isoform X2 [Anneissia japonica]|uniref:leucine-rich repeat-containing protein 63-like isoform X2 n=1 Tax=Anneissia japonica TaxID=1529436 RepID=UPI0014259D95|nr:leucine-rich repeat-containing protein 63-like isoform X2 [Anneissia japonica]
MATTTIMTKPGSQVSKKSKQLLRRPIPPPQPLPPKKVESIPAKNVALSQLAHQDSKSNSSSCRGLSPIPSVAPTLESCSDNDIEGFQTPANTPRTRQKSRKSQTRSHSPSYLYPSVNANDWRFILESRYQKCRDHSKMESFSVVKPYKPRGPDPFPFREPVRPAEVRKELLYSDSFDIYNFKFPEFTLNDFQFDINAIYNMSKSTMTEAVLSKQNYKKLTTLFATFIETPRQEEVNTVQLKGEDIPVVKPRIPQRQLLVEMAYIVRQQMRDLMNNGMQIGMADIRSLSSNAQLSPLRKDKMGKRTQKKESDMYCANEAIFTMPVAKYFQGAKRNKSPFTDFDPSSTITPAELAILDCLVNGGLALSLKAHFISELPEITPLMRSLTYLNLSFNDFWDLPPEILNLKQLEVLKMRNNPIKELPQDIYKLKKLRTLVVSFCLISSLPMSLYTLPLQFLDLSYNRISYLPNELKQLKQLRALNVEGNQLAALPAGSLKLSNLYHLRVKNNYMHPYLWFENSTNNPQRLSDMSALVLKQHELENAYVDLSVDLQMILNSYTTCDCCQGPLYGSGLRLIRPCRKAFGVKRLPFYFLSCSPRCRDFFMSNVESLSEILYNEEPE